MDLAILPGNLGDRDGPDRVGLTGSARQASRSHRTYGFVIQKEAECVFREALDQRPRDGRLLFGLWQSLVAQKRDNEAALVAQRFNAAWKDATTVKLRIEDL